MTQNLQVLIFQRLSLTFNICMSLEISIIIKMQRKVWNSLVTEPPRTWYEHLTFRGMEVQISNWYIFQMVKYPKQSGCFCIPFFIHLDCCLPLNKILSVKNMVLFNHYRAFKPSLILIEFYSICYYQ